MIAIGCVLVFAFATLGIRALGYRGVDYITNPAIAGFGFLLLSSTAFPLLWTARPSVRWDDLLNPGEAVVTLWFFTAAALVGIVTAGPANSATGSMAAPMPVRRLPQLHRNSGIRCIIASLVGLGMLYVLNPSIFAAAGNLVRKHGDDLTTGLGPLYSLFAVSLWVTLFGSTATRRDQVVYVGAILTFGACVFLTGQKSRFAVLGLFLAYRWLSVRFKLSPRVVVSAIAGALAAVVAITEFQVEVRGGGVVRRFEGIDRSTPVGYLEYAAARFGHSTFDMARTVGRITSENDASAGVASIEPLVGSIVSPVPSVLLGGSKPKPASHFFSAEFFHERWLAGTGIPPSLAAELIWYLGLPLALLAFVALFSFIARRARAWNATPAGVWRHGLRALSVPTFVMFLKAGSDGGVRFAVTFWISLLIFQVLVSRPIDTESNRAASAASDGAAPRAAKTRHLVAGGPRGGRSLW